MYKKNWISFSLPVLWRDGIHTWMEADSLSRDSGATATIPPKDRIDPVCLFRNRVIHPQMPAAVAPEAARQAVWGCFRF